MQHLSTCTLCEATCGIRVTVDAGRVTRIEGDPDDPFSQGYICPKAAALADLQHDPDRLTHPLRKTKGGWAQVAWDDALDEAAERLHGLRQAHGRDSVAVYLGNPNVHNMGAMLYGPMLIRALRTKRRYSATSVDQLPHMLAAQTMFGHALLMPVPDVDRCDLLLVFGANPVVSNGSIMTAPFIRKRLQAIAQRGQVHVFDPRHTETARIATAYHAIRPGTDALALLAMLHVVFTERAPSLGHLAEGAAHLDRLRALAADFPPERVAEPTGVPAQALRGLAHALLDTPRAAVYGRMGACTQDFGGITAMLLYALNAVTGHLDTPGGLMFAQPAVDAVHPPLGRPGRARPRFGRWHSRVRELPECYGELPVATLAEDILTPGEDAIRGMLVWAGNPVLSCPNGHQMDRALASLDFMVAVDLYRNETNRHADLILPAVPPLSRDHYDLAFNLLAVRNHAKFAPAVLPAPDHTRQDWQIALGLQTRLERLAGAPLRQRALTAATQRLGPRGLLDVALRLGPNGARAGRKGLSLRRLRAAPHGVDLGPLRPCLKDRLPRDWPGVDLYPDAYTSARDALLRSLGPEPPELVLVGRRLLHSNNSWLHNSQRLLKGKDRCTLLVHPSDAARLGVASGDQATVASRVGTITAPVQVSDEVMPGVVSLPHGFGHDREGVGWTFAAAHPGRSVNDLTDDQRVDGVSGNAALNGTPVTVSPA